MSEAFINHEAPMKLGEEEEASLFFGEASGANEANEEVASPLVEALEAHFQRYYSSDPTDEAGLKTFASRNQVIPPLNLDLLNSQIVVEMNK
jgi:hypothetical protein